MTSKNRKRRLKKPVKIGLAIFLALIVTGTLGFLTQKGIIEPSEIVGAFTLDNSPGERDPSITEYLLNFTEKPISIGENRWTLYQRYRLDDPRYHQYCEIDCANFCTDKDEGFYKGYIQSWGKCMCKCQIELEDHSDHDHTHDAEE